MSVDTVTVKKVASLARIAIDEAAAERLVPELNNILGWVEQLGENEYRVHGRNAERVVALNDVTTPEALNYIDERLAKLGVPKLLTRAGVVEGDVVWIAQFSFEFVPEM